MNRSSSLKSLSVTLYIVKFFFVNFFPTFLQELFQDFIDLENKAKNKNKNKSKAATTKKPCKQIFNVHDFLISNLLF